MKYLNLQERFMKKTFVFNKYILKSGLLDLIGLFLFIVLLLIVSASIQQYSSAAQVYESDYQQLLQDESIEDSFKSSIADDYLASLNDLVLVIIISFAGLITLSFIFGSFVKTWQYKMLDGKLYTGWKHYFKKVGITIRNTLPLFVGFWLIALLMFSFVRLSGFFFILLLIFWIVYLFAMPVLRIFSLRHSNFKKSWKLLFKSFEHALVHKPFLLVLSVVWIIISAILGYVNVNLITIPEIQYVLAVVQLILLILLFVFSRRYLYVSTYYIERLIDDKKEKN